MSDIVTSRIFVDGEKGITAAKLNDIVASSVIQPEFYTAKPTAGSADPSDIALILKSGAYAQVPVSSLGGSVTQGQIWSIRQNSYNSIGNPNFEVDQRQCGAAVAPAANIMAIDRWNWNQSFSPAVMRFNGQQMAAGVAAPGSNYFISSKFYRITVTTPQASLGTNDWAQFRTSIEGPNLRELFGGVHSVSLLVRTSIPNLKFGLVLSDPPSAHGFFHLCTIPAANVWTLVTIPNIPLWTAAGNWSTTPGTLGYYLGITLVAGPSLIASANDAWIASSASGAIGQSNFAATAGATFDVAFCQHEPGSVCSTLMDTPFTQNLDNCLRFFCKSNPYATKPGTVNSQGVIYAVALANGTPSCYVPFKKVMAKMPTVTGYSDVSGAAGTVRDLYAPGDRLISGLVGVGDSSFGGFNLTTVNAVNALYSFHYTADTGW
jgi:hypothetical protein